MPIVTFDYHDFINLLGHTIDKNELIEKLPMIGADLDKVEGDEISIEFFPNRPDLTSVEGIARAARAFFGFHTGLTTYNIHPSDITLQVDPSVKTVRPYVVTALIKNVMMSDELIASLMDLQEKLHFGLGRNRKKVAIGVHNYEPVFPPFTYKAVDPDAIQFIPLQKTEYMTLREILTKHEKGVDYAHILDEHDRYPLIVDKNNNVLSFPPIINGSLTEVTPYTNEIFIDVTGTDPHVIDGDSKNITPNLSPQTQTLTTGYVNKILGTTLINEEIKICLEKMGYNVTYKDTENLEVDIPAWRSDILHEIDIVEDVAVGYGYDQFSTDFPQAQTFGKTLPQQNLFTSLRYSMIGLGFTEVTTFTISNPRDEFTQLGMKIQAMVTIENPIGEEYSGIRVNLLPSLLKILRENRHHSLPQQIYELGPVINAKGINEIHLSGLKIGAKANFTECKGLIEAILRNLGIPLIIQDYTHSAFISGRCAKIISNNTDIGWFGELHPQTIQAFELDHPIIAFELNCNTLL
jgi:phenylalanyl-tRNA synthetase beta chain